MALRVLRGFVVLGACAVLVAGCSKGAKSHPDGYASGPGRNQLTVHVTEGQDSTATVKLVEQTAQAVTLEVRLVRGSQDKDASHNDIGIPREVVIDLDAPLGTRTVLDEDGDPVPSLVKSSS